MLFRLWANTNGIDERLLTMTGYNKDVETEIFSRATEHFERIVSALITEDMQEKEHSDVEGYLRDQGTELLRLLLQGHLDKRAQSEEVLEGVVGDDGVMRRCKRSDCKRQLESLFGRVRVRRIGYSNPGFDQVFPLDASLNLPPDQYSHGLRRVVARSVAQGSFDDAVNDVKQHTGGNVPKRQVEQIAERVSRDFEGFYQQDTPENVNGNDLLVLTTDAKGIVVRKEDLRESTRKAAENEQHKKKTRLSRGEKKNRKRMAQVASVYDVQPHARSANQIMDADKDNQAQRKKEAPKPTNKRVWASIEKDAGEVVRKMFEEAQRRDPSKERQWLALVDGNKDQIKMIESVATDLVVNVVIIMDFVHVLEYLWKAAHGLFDENDPTIEEWVNTNATQLLESKTRQVAANMRRQATRLGLSQEQRVPIDKCANYLSNNRKCLDYKTALENGWPIATGVIEGACRYLIKDRMDITGARWSLSGAESVLKLRALKSSGDLDAYMSFHTKQEQHRNYTFADIPIGMTA